MAKKVKKLRQSRIAPQKSNPFAAAYAARLARQVGQELASPRQARAHRKKAGSRSK
jgi:hypothetical protein